MLHDIQMLDRATSKVIGFLKIDIGADQEWLSILINANEWNQFFAGDNNKFSRESQEKRQFISQKNATVSAIQFNDATQTQRSNIESLIQLRENKFGNIVSALDVLDIDVKFDYTTAAPSTVANFVGSINQNITPIATTTTTVGHQYHLVVKKGQLYSERNSVGNTAAIKKTINMFAQDNYTFAVNGEVYLHSGLHNDLLTGFIHDGVNNLYTVVAGVIIAIEVISAV